MLPIKKRFTGHTISNRKGAKPEWIVWHYFGALGSAWDTAGWFCNPANNVGSADFTIDDDNIIQVNPDIDNFYTWHCGGGLQGYIRHSKFGICRNANSIGLELRPYNDRGSVSAAQNAGWYFHDATVKNAIDLTKQLMEEYDIDADHVIMHADVTGKYCPAPFLDRPAEWEAVQKALRAEGAAVPAPVNPTSDKVYRVRKSVNDAASQIGAWISLDSAIDQCDANPGYAVYNNRYEVVYPVLDEFRVRVDVTDLRIRKGPGTNYGIVDYIKSGIYTIVSTKEAEGFLWGELKSGAGWIALDYTRKI